MRHLFYWLLVLALMFLGLTMSVNYAIVPQDCMPKSQLRHIANTPIGPTITTTSFVVFPQDCNANPPMLFGGKTLSEMDRCAGITARRFLYNSPTGAKDAVTASINEVKFHKGAQVKDLITLTGKITKVGIKTITIQVTVERELANEKELIADGEFVYCAFNLEQKRAIAHGLDPK